MVLICAASVMAGHAPRPPDQSLRPRIRRSRNRPSPEPVENHHAKRTAPPESSHAAFPDHWAMQLIDQKLIMNHTPKHHRMQKEADGPCRTRVLQFDLNPRTQALMQGFAGPMDGRR